MILLSSFEDESRDEYQVSRLITSWQVRRRILVSTSGILLSRMMSPDLSCIVEAVLGELADIAESVRFS